MKTTRHLLRLAALLGLASLLSQTGSAQTSAFTYQGVLQDGAGPVTGLYDFEFRVFNAASGGGQVGVLTTAADVPVTNGLFTATIDPGAGTGVFPGGARWLNIAVRPGASTGAYTNLSPRQPITSTPYASFARGAAAAGVTGTLPSGALSGAYSGSLNLSNVANAFAGSGAGLTALDASQLTSGNVSDARLSANVALRAGGNSFTGNQTVTGGNVGIGTTTPADALSVVGNGRFDGANARLRFFNGATLNSEIGVFNDTKLFLANKRNGPLGFETAGAERLTVDTNGNVGIGMAANLSGKLTLGNAKGDGTQTVADGIAFMQANGFSHAGIWAVGSSGFNGNLVFGTDGDGANNRNVTEKMRITAAGNVGIGISSPASLLHLHGTGEQLRFSTSGAGDYRTVCGQGLNGDPNAFTINALGDVGTFGSIQLYTGGTSRMTIGSPAQGGNVGIGTNNPATKLHVAGEITCTVANITSDRNAKEDFKPISAREVLEKVARLAITEWQYKEVPGVRHIGPVAQDFHAAFSTGRDDRHISSVDADGVALAAIQGLSEVVEEKEAEIGALKDRLTAMEARFRALEEALQQATKLR